MSMAFDKNLAQKVRQEKEQTRFRRAESLKVLKYSTNR